MSAIVTFVLSMLAQLPQDIAAIQNAYTSIKGALGTKDIATLDAIFNALNAKTDADVSAFDQAATAHGG